MVSMFPASVTTCAPTGPTITPPSKKAAIVGICSRVKNTHRTPATRMQKTARPRKTAQEIVEEAHHDSKEDREGDEDDNEWRPKKCDLHIVGLDSGGIHSSR